MTLVLPMSLPLTRRLEPMLRRRRTPIRPVLGNGRYRLPRAVLDLLGSSLSGFRNAEATFALAAFIARFWTAPGRLGAPFPIDRRALAGHPDLGLTEGQVRGAIRTLERIGFLDRSIVERGSRYQQRGDELHRKPVLFEFGEPYGAAFRKANLIARAVGQKERFPTGIPSPRLPKTTHQTRNVVIMGQVRGLPKGTSDAPRASPLKLEEALSRLERAIQASAPSTQKTPV